MDDVLAALSAQHRELEALLARLDADGWRRPSHCPGWTVSDVVLHLAQTDEMAVASAQGRFVDLLGEMVAGLEPASSVDDGAGLLVEHQRGAAPAEVHARWRRGTTELDVALRAVDPSARLQWVAGELSARTLATTRLAEAWIHTGDIAFAFDLPPSATDRLWHIARLAWRTLPYAMARAGRALTGTVAFDLTGPQGQPWRFADDDDVDTVVNGPALDLCLVAGQRVDARHTELRATGPDAAAVLELVRTFA